MWSRFLDQTKKIATDVFKTGSKTTFHKAAERSDDLIGIKDANKTTRTATNELKDSKSATTLQSHSEFYADTTEKS